MGVDAAFVFPVPQSGNDDLGEARENLLLTLTSNDSFADLVEHEKLFIPGDLMGAPIHPLTKSLLVIHSDCRFLSPKAPKPQGKEATNRWSQLRPVMKTVVEASRQVSFTAPWYIDDLTSIEFTHELVFQASRDRAYFVNTEFIDFMEQTFGSKRK